jgi:hypothetical protein
MHSKYASVFFSHNNGGKLRLLVLQKKRFWQTCVCFAAYTSLGGKKRRAEQAGVEKERGGRAGGGWRCRVTGPRKKQRDKSPSRLVGRETDRKSTSHSHPGTGKHEQRWNRVDRARLVWEDGEEEEEEKDVEKEQEGRV